MTMQNKLYAIQFFFPPDGVKPKSQSLSSDHGIPEIMNFEKFPKKTELPEKFELPNKRGFKLTETIGAEIPAPRPTPIHKLSMMSMVWNISIGQLGLAAWLSSLPAPAHLLIS